MAHESKKALSARAQKIVAALQRAYPEPECALVHESPLQLLIATILSAQCTDKRVNMVTPQLFARYATARDFAEADPTELAEIIRSTGFYQNKTKSIIGCCQALVARHRGAVPLTIEALVKLPGVGRKTANVVLGTAWGIAVGVVVDTHVKRIAGLLQLTRQTDPEKIEQDLMAVIPQDYWIGLSHALIWHGRQVCIARRPQCEACVLSRWCPGRT